MISVCHIVVFSKTFIISSWVTTILVKESTLLVNTSTLSESQEMYELLRGVNSDISTAYLCQLSNFEIVESERRS